ncbi:leucyl aminopeptidase [Anaerosalibacter bizertensis]|uniref:leucyl aminopeptidase n=1 Tax=Anaerosalibacter bizertensis TaxID=932217 RepID=UPI001C0EF9BF|nr:leucyl aminopeptidase [Anaerosalibacter bizertensis]MBU5292458.1 leucyl aminopeptidase [Anaerosalibacter bizertensis]
MNFKLQKGGEVKIIPVTKETKELEDANELYSYLMKKDLFKGNCGEIYSNALYSKDKVILLGLGEKNKITCNSLRKAFYNLGVELMDLKIESADISIPIFKNIDYKNTVQVIVEGLLQSEYSFEKYLTKKKTIPSVENIYLDILEEKKEETIEAIEETKNLIEGVFLTRNLVNEPAMYMTPKALANNAKKELEQVGVEVKVYGAKEIEELGMEAFLAVSKGSSQEPQLIVMNYKGNPNSDEKLALVGKGLTYDSGGYSIKTSNGMVTMHSDMAGSASVIGAMKSIAMSKLKKNVVGIIAACENMISGKAYKPGDIIGSMSGKTIEVLNTDAEGRLTLADALWYAADVVKADKIIDIATLTGACVVALGNINTGAITNNDTLMNNVNKAAEIAGEPVWELPHNDEYKELIKGTFADLKNSGGRGAGTITAGLFLQEFVKDTPWVHLDIAGTSYLSSKNAYLPKGATGVPVKTLYFLAKEY